VTAQRSAEDADFAETWVDDDELAEEWTTSYPPDNLVTFRYIWAAIRRHARLWIVVALAGLVAGLALPAVLPPASSSSVKLLLTHRQGDDPVRAMATDVNLLQTNTVAQRVINELGLSVAPDELLDAYTATALTDRVMEIVATAPTSEQATELAGTVAEVYLPFRDQQVALPLESLREELSSAQTAVQEARAALVAAGENPDDSDPSSSPEWTTYTRAVEGELFIEQQILDHNAQATRMRSSRVLDAAVPIPRSERMAMAISAASGLIAGLSLGLGFVVVRALISDRLWIRRDIARALGAPVRLSVRGVPRWIWRIFPQYVGRSRMRRPALRLVTQRLRAIVLRRSSPKPALVIVGVDNVRASACIVASLALTLADKGKRVLVADLSGGVLAKGLGLSGEGTHEARLRNTEAGFTVHVPSPDDAPLLGRRLQGGSRAPTDDNAIDVAWTQADVVLALATLSPALGAEHLRPWSSEAVAIVTAGRSSATLLHATGEMIRLAGIRLDSAILLRADKTDDSVGLLEPDTARVDTAPDIEAASR